VILPTDGHTHNWDEPVAIIEVKLVYQSYSVTKIRTYVRRLLDQVQAAREQAPSSYGFLFAVYSWWGAGRSPLTFEAFRKRVLTVLLEEVDARKDVQLARRTLETFVPERQQRIGGTTVPIGVAAQYLVARAE
jgi:hypothetical protein